jgi:pyridoxamine 5'-phosphate oxidase
VTVHDDDPWARVRQWLQPDLHGPLADAFMLATASPTGVPSARIVSLRGLEPGALILYTHDGSRKVRELDANPRFAAVFHFDSERRQLRLEGTAERMARAQAERYFATRPRAAQISALVSSQGRPSPGLDVLRASCDKLAAQIGGGPIPCPADFIGMRLVPTVIEFWLGSEDRLHERVVHLLDAGRWRTLALQP